MTRREEGGRVGWLAGRVVSFSGQHLPGARVFCWVHSKSGRAPVEALSDDSGRFRLGPLPVGATQVFWCEALQHARLRVGERDCPQIAVLPDRTNDVGDIILAPEIVAAGRVLDADGEPLADARVVATSYFHQLAHTVAQNGPSTEVRTSVDGSFCIGSLAPGSLQVEVLAPGFARLRTGAEIECTHSRIDLGVLRFCSVTTPLSGTVKDRQGRPVAGGRITANDDDGVHAITDAAGRFHLMARSDRVGFASASHPVSGQRWSKRVVDPACVEFVIQVPQALRGRVCAAKTKQPIAIEDLSLCEVMRREFDGAEFLVG